MKAPRIDPAAQQSAGINEAFVSVLSDKLDVLDQRKGMKRLMADLDLYGTHAEPESPEPFDADFAPGIYLGR